MFEALVSKEPFHLDFQVAAVISLFLFISKQPTYCQERVGFSFWCSVVRSGRNGEMGLLFCSHSQGIQCFFWQLGGTRSRTSGALCLLKKVALVGGVCQAVFLGHAPCVPRGLPDTGARLLGALLVLRSDGGCALRLWRLGSTQTVCFK